MANEKNESLDVNSLVTNFNESLGLSTWLEVAVKEPTRRNTTTIGIQDSYVVYLIESTITDRSKIFSGWLEKRNDETFEGSSQIDHESFPSTISVWRRYSEFDILKDYLMVTFPYLVIPPLPEKRLTGAWQAASTTSSDNADPEFLERRRIYLEQFLKRIFTLSDVSQDQVLLSFLYTEEWKEVVASSKYHSLRDSRLKSLSASYRIKKPNDKFELIKKYAQDLQQYVGGILKCRAKATEHLYGIHKIHSNYGREFSEWSSIERKDMAEGLQKMGHYLDNFAQDIDMCIEGEEDFADQLKEYYGYCESLRHLCKKQELMQLDLEQLGDALASKRIDRENLSQGKTGIFGGFKAKVFGGNTPEQKEGKLKALDEEILKMEEKVKASTESLTDFEEKALANVERFSKQKMADVTDIFVTHVMMTLERCKKSRATWQHIKKACECV
ncbi:sorting nexin-4-like [Watersipora subatra]|uniref:sorting nexin-4-like n=1 Tax=Watersipora subatra TaxID=2589382 RepID=UPI00355AE502